MSRAVGQRDPEVERLLATSNPSTIPDIGDLFYVTVGGGLQDHF